MRRRRREIWRERGGDLERDESLYIFKFIF